MRRILFIILGIILCHAAQAQYKDIQKLPQPLRDSILIDVANKAIDKYSIGYLQPGREPVIEDIGVVSKDMLTNRKDRSGLDWPEYYGVYFYAVYYKTTEEEKSYYSSSKDFLVKVFIRADNCRPVNIRYWDEGYMHRSGLDRDEEMARIVPEKEKKNTLLLLKRKRKEPIWEKPFIMVREPRRKSGKQTGRTVSNEILSVGNIRGAIGKNGGLIRCAC